VVASPVVVAKVDISLFVITRPEPGRESGGRWDWWSVFVFE